MTSSVRTKLGCSRIPRLRRHAPDTLEVVAQYRVAKLSTTVVVVTKTVVVTMLSVGCTDVNLVGLFWKASRIPRDSSSISKFGETDSSALETAATKSSKKERETAKLPNILRCTSKINYTRGTSLSFYRFWNGSRCFLVN